MAPSKEWMSFINDRLNEQYKVGVTGFLNYAFSKMDEECEIRCPCVKCQNTDKGSREVVEMHLYVYGMMPNYTFWYHHSERRGESKSEEVEESDSEEEIQEILQDLYPDFCCFDKSDDEIGSSSRIEHEEKPNEKADAFYRLLKDFEQPTYPGCEISKLSTLVNLQHIKSIGRWSNESFDMLLKMLKEILPMGSTLPETYYDSKKIIKDLGLSYEKIDACVNNCMLYWRDEEKSDFCRICGVSRWKEDCRSGETKIQKNGKKVPAKTMRYFPLKPRLQRLYMSRKTASDMRWHHESRVDDGDLRHPADSLAWKSFDEIHKEFASEPRNVRLGLATDGFQPFTQSKTSYSIWPVILIPYNVPPWMCMKESNFILSMLIPGPDGPGDAIDVYLRPLIEELRELWEVGVDTFDVSTHTNFRLHASLLWTINDFPAYGYTSGWSTKGKMACPCCNKDTYSIRLVNGNKECFMGHRCYLPMDHKWRKDGNSFDGTIELRSPPKTISDTDVLAQVHDLEGITLTKDSRKRVKISHEKRGDNWNKKSVFFDLPYWSTLLLRHNLDVMHIEKNICDNIIGTIMNMKGKSKDNVQARLDLEVMKIRPDLHPIRKGDKLELPVAAYTLSKEEKHLFCLFLKQLKVPDGFSSNISQCVNIKEHKISGLKSHDCHILLQHLLPLGIRGLLPKSVCEPLIELALFFTSLCAKTLSVDQLKQIESKIPITLCKLEQVFLPSFFDVMVHLPVHLASEAQIGGPVHYRWMYPIERMLCELRKLIHNMARPEGSIAEGYIAKECMTLCSRYFKDTKTKFNKLDRNYDGGSHKTEGEVSIFPQFGRALGAGISRNLNEEEWIEAHAYVLKNCDEVQPFLEEYSQIQQNRPQKSNKDWSNSFISWFKTRVAEMDMQDQPSNYNSLQSLSRGPLKYVTCFNDFVVNGFRFRIEDCDKGCVTQNCGVCVIGDIGSDTNYVEYYRVLTEILELQYLGGKRVVVFRCRWFDVHDSVKGAKTDRYGFTTINCQRIFKTNEPFILAKQASQVFYAIDNLIKGWHVVTKIEPRDLYKMPLREEVDDNYVGDIRDGEAYQHGESFNLQFGGDASLDLDNQNTWMRTDVEPMVVAASTVKRKRKRKAT